MMGYPPTINFNRIFHHQTFLFWGTTILGHTKIRSANQCQAALTDWPRFTPKQRTSNSISPMFIVSFRVGVSENVVYAPIGPNWDGEIIWNSLINHGIFGYAVFRHTQSCPEPQHRVIQSCHILCVSSVTNGPRHFQSVDCL